MPTILTHPAVPLAIGLGLGSNVIPKRLLLAGVVASIIPDLDVVTIQFGVERGSQFAHRGFTHSAAFALALGIVAACAARSLRASAVTAFLFVLAAAASHGILDGFTNGGSGIAFLWPFSDGRWHAPWRVIEVSYIGAGWLFSARGAEVLASEFMWVWLPAAGIAAALMLGRRR